MKKTNWVIGGVLVIAGIILTAAPVFVTKALIVLLGLGAVADGVYSLMYERDISASVSYQKPMMIKSVANVIAGLLAVLIPLFFVKTAWFAITYILAFYLIASACFGFYAASQLKDSAVDRKAITVENLFHLLAAVLLFVIGPEKLGKSIVRLIGILTMLVGAGVLVIQALKLKNTTVVKNVDVRDE